MDRFQTRSTAITTLCVVAMAAGAALTGCSPQEEPPKVESSAVPTDAASTDPTKSPTVTSTPDDTGADEPAANADFTFPACNELISDTRAQELSGNDRYVPIADPSGMRTWAFEHAFGPVAGEAFSRADISTHCVWGLPNSDASSQVFIAVLDDAQRAELEAAFGEAFGDASHLGDAVLYEDHIEGGISSLYRNFWFTGDIWVSHFTSSETSLFGYEALVAAAGAYSAASAS